MICCRKAKSEEYEDIIDFINYVFSQDQCPHDFKKLLPKLYADGKNYAGFHYLIKEEEKIRALICAMPLSYRIGKNSLKTCCIGVVSVHPYARSKGYMKKLMSYVMEDMDRQGFQYTFLGGQRQRYEYFGFEPSGIQIGLEVMNVNIRHCFKELDASPVRIIPLEEEDFISKAYSLYEKQQIRAIREKEEFYDILCTWQAKPYAVLLNTEFIGYLSLSQHGGITELLLEKADYYPYVLKALFSFTGKEKHSFAVSPLEGDKINALMDIAESARINTSENYRIRDWEAVIGAFLEAKAAAELLAEGSVILAVDETVLEITVKENEVLVHRQEKEPDLAFTALQATALLFSAPGGIRLQQYCEKLNVQKKNCIKSWFPLPLTAFPNDCC